MICCFFSSFKTFAMSREATDPPAAVNVLDVSSESMAAFQVFLYGRFWVFTEVVIDRIFQILKQGVPYDYVEGQLWQLIASIGTPKDLRRLMGAFKKRSKKRDRMALEMGLIAFA